MASSTSSYAPLLLVLSFAFSLLICQSSPQNLKSYIVYTGNSMKDEASALSLYTSMLQEVADSNNEPKSVLHHYKRSFGGFVAKLTEEEAELMAGLDGVISVFPNKKNELHTTRSWDFIGFPLQVERAANASNIIIGVIDTGIWPESESFNDNGFGPPPSKWKGSCQGTNFTCNNKIIGARYYRIGRAASPGEQGSPRDISGHGTHVASTAAGNPVSNASMLGFGAGTARGGSSSARIAVYKVCWRDGCYNAFDDAIADGVDIITASLGIPAITNYFDNVISIGSFHAMKNGVLTAASAGNRGPGLSTVTNYAPWLISVASSTIDRKFVTRVQLGNNRTYVGTSVINTFDLKGEFYPLIYGGHVSGTCSAGALNKNLAKGRIVLCDGGLTNGTVPFYAEAAGSLTSQDLLRDDNPISLALPGSHLTGQEGQQVHVYILNTRTPIGTIYKSDEVKDTFAPSVASRSSRGPNPITPDILKPDLIAPGVAILAAWSPDSPPSGVNGDERKLEFNIISGTSMACPHVAGAAAYIKTFHPTWSPAAIRSALMSTATRLNPTFVRFSDLEFGAGQIDPIKAVNPGLVYDASEIDYVRFLCGQGYSTRQLQMITRDNSTCSVGTNYVTARDLNYPSFALQVTPANSYVRGSFIRTVTNVGSPRSTYRASVFAHQGLIIRVNPSVLSFTSLGQKQSFVLTIEGSLSAFGVSTSLVWSDGLFQVRSPIIVFNDVTNNN